MTLFKRRVLCASISIPNDHNSEKPLSLLIGTHSYWKSLTTKQINDKYSLNKIYCSVSPHRTKKIHINRVKIRRTSEIWRFSNFKFTNLLYEGLFFVLCDKGHTFVLSVFFGKCQSSISFEHKKQTNFFEKIEKKENRKTIERCESHLFTRLKIDRERLQTNSIEQLQVCICYCK